MKRLHIHVNVDDLSQSIRFYTTLFGTEPTTRKSDYAKWLLDDPAVNLAISTHAAVSGIDHVGIQTDSKEELGVLADRLKSASLDTLPQEAANCCYAVSDKHWVRDPSGVQWETFFTHGESTVYGEDTVPANAVNAPQQSCC